MAERADAMVICEHVDEMLNVLLDQDFFGTEGQLDPRGDHRDCRLAATAKL